MASWIYKVESNCNDPKRESEFHAWYNEIHLPDIFKTKGFVRATRYELTQPVEGQGKFLALYEIQTDDIDTVWAKHQENLQQTREQGRSIDFITVVSRGLYRQIYRFPE